MAVQITDGLFYVGHFCRTFSNFSDAFFVVQICRTLLKTLKYMIQHLYEVYKEQASNGNVRHLTSLNLSGTKKPSVFFVPFPS